jgi:hypothetical protein
MSSRKRASSVQLGHDAFLDIVANLVGILIILVVVLGTQSQSAIREIQEQTKAEQVTPPSNSQMETLTKYSMAAAHAQADSDRFEQNIKQLDAQIERRKQQRGILMDLLAKATTAWEQRKQELDAQSTRLAAENVELERNESALSRLQGERKRLEDQPDPVVAVEHLPTPMAKTVFGEEVHFRLKENRLSVVPIDQLIAEIRRDFARVSSGSRVGQLDAAVGPIRGYVARYVMDKSRQRMMRGGSMTTGTRIQLVGMMVEPLNEPHGTPVDQVLIDGKELDIELAGRTPGKTTITVWVYPDSYAAFRQLKEHLYAKGYATAARPLPAGKPITGGPGGTRSSAQ